jgi:hypothetical protein
VEAAGAFSFDLALYSNDADESPYNLHIMGNGIDTGVDETEIGIPAEFELTQNFPNPFNPETTISFGLPKSSHVTLTVFNTKGQIIQTLVDEIRNAGYHSVQWDASLVPSGIYVYQIRAEGFTMVKKCMLMK